MRKLLLISGYILLTIGILSVIPMFDLLPVDVLAKIINIFSSEEEIVYFKVVPSKHGYTLNIIIITVGALFVILGKYLALKNKGEIS